MAKRSGTAARLASGGGDFQTIDRPYEVFAKESVFPYSDASGDSRTFELNLRDSGLLDSLEVRAFHVDQTKFVFDPFSNEAEESLSLKYTLSDNMGPYFIADPSMGKRSRLGSIQTALNEVRLAEEQLYNGLKSMQSSRVSFETNLKGLEAAVTAKYVGDSAKRIKQAAEFVFDELKTALKAI